MHSTAPKQIMSEILDLIGRYHILSPKQLHHIMHSYTGVALDGILRELASLERKGVLVSSKHVVAPSPVAYFYYKRPDSLFTGGVVSYENTKPHMDTLVDAPPSLGFYLNAARPLEALDKAAMHDLIAQDIAMTNHLNDLVEKAVNVGATDFPDEMSLAFTSTVLLNKSLEEQGISIHKYNLEEYYIDQEQHAWSGFLRNVDGANQLQDAGLRQYIAMQFPHLLFDRPDLLEDGNVFDRAFVKSFHPGLTCIHDIAALTDDDDERIALFLAAVDQLGADKTATLPDDIGFTDSPSC